MQPPARALLPRMAGNFSGVAVVVNLIFTRTIGAPTERNVKYRNRDLVGSGATRGASSSRKSEFAQSDDSSFFQARGEMLEGPKQVKSRRAPAPISR
jgi:hypothetical protein